MTFYLYHAGDAYEITVGVAGITVICYRGCIDSNSCTIDIADMPQACQVELMARLREQEPQPWTPTDDNNIDT